MGKVISLGIYWNIDGCQTVIYIEDDRLKSINAYRNAFSGSRDDTLDARRINQLSGDMVEIVFDRDSITLIAGYGNAKSLYFLSSEESADGANQNAADTIFIRFAGGEPENIL